MGMKQLPKKSGEYLFEIMMRRYENRSTIMTTNRPIKAWKTIQIHLRTGLTQDIT